MRFVGLAILLVVSVVRGQIPASSPALDPDFVTLTKKESFAGRYAIQLTGAIIKTIRPLQWDIPQGGVFLNGVDTLDATPTSQYNPVGPFLQGSDFSLFNRARFRLNRTYQPTLVYSKGLASPPVLAAAGYYLGDYLATAYFLDSTNTYSDSNRHELSRKDTSNIFDGTYSHIYSSYWDKDTLEDLVLIHWEMHPGLSTFVYVWKAEDLVYKGVVRNDRKVIPATEKYTIQTAYNYNLERPFILDLDKNGAPDIVFISDSIHSNKGAQGPRYLTTVFGKHENSEWIVDTVVHSELSEYPYSLKIMDFLHNDGVPDFLLGTIDTIYCINGVRDFRQSFSLSDAALKIPSPAKFDLGAFKGQGLGKLSEWGLRLHDLGNINGSGEHALGVTCYLVNDTAKGIGGPSYCFIYSGGKAADEYADAIFADRATEYTHFTSMDSVWVNRPDEILNFLLGDPSYSIGGNGILYYFEGRADIPHKPDPRWQSAVKQYDHRPEIKLIVYYSSNRITVSIRTSGNADGKLMLRDMLGRTVATYNVYAGSGDERVVDINTDAFAKGVYIVTYEQSGAAASQKVYLMQFGEADARRFLPEQWHAVPFVPEYAFTVSNEYLSRWIGAPKRYRATR